MMKTGKDFLGQELNIGDQVVFMQIKYRGLMKGVITKVTDETVMISHKKTNMCSTESRQFQTQTIKIKVGEEKE